MRTRFLDFVDAFRVQILRDGYNALWDVVSRLPGLEKRCLKHARGFDPTDAELAPRRCPNLCRRPRPILLQCAGARTGGQRRSQRSGDSEWSQSALPAQPASSRRRVDVFVVDPIAVALRQWAQDPLLDPDGRCRGPILRPQVDSPARLPLG